MITPRLNRKLDLEAKNRSPDGLGGYSEEWIALGQLWAEITPKSGRERQESGLTISTVTYKIVVRAAPQGASSRPMPEQRLRDGARVYVIQAVTEFDHDGRYLTCFAEEEVVT